MPLAIPMPLGLLWQSNLAAAARAGTTVTASATAHTKGNWVTLIATTNAPSYGIVISGGGVGAAATNTSMLLDIGFGVAGSEAVIVPDIYVGNAGLSSIAPGKSHWLPIYIPTGVRVAARCQAAVVSDTVTVIIYLCQKPLFPIPVSRWDAYGEDAATSNGVSVTPGSGAFGAWTQVPAASTTARAHKLWTVQYGIGTDTTIVGAEVLVEIGHGPADPPRSIGVFRFTQSSAELVDGPHPQIPVYRPVPSGEQLWARIASAETEARRIVIYAGD